MNFAFRTIQKNGFKPEENEDYFACSKDLSAFAISDGATESSYSAIWAEMLAKSFTESPFNYLSQNIVLPFKDMNAFIDEKLCNPSISWFAKEKAQQGSWATLLGIEFKQGLDNKDFEWHACAAGDSNLFLIRNNQLEIAFPITKPQDFNCSPTLLGSNIESQNQLINQFKFAKGSFLQGDIIFLMTDAIAKWFLEEIKKDNGTENTLITIQKMLVTDESFYEQVEMLRNLNLLKNDDTTLIQILP